MKKIVTLIIILSSVIYTYAQSTNAPLGFDTYDYMDRFDIKYGKILPVFHSADKPYSLKSIALHNETLRASNIVLSKSDKFNSDYLLNSGNEWFDSTKSISKKPFLKYFYREPANFYSVRTKKDEFILKFNPLLELAIGTEFGDKMLLKNTRGVECRFSIKKRVSAYFAIYENQLLMPEYIDSTTSSKYAQARVPGFGYYKDYKPRYFKNNQGVDFFDYRGYITFNILQHIDVSFGHDKNFIGDGIRSLFLSDNSAPYLFLKINTHIWKINYQNIFCEVIGQYKRGGDMLLDKKYTAFHHLSVQPTYWLNIGFFEGVIMTRKKSFDIQYLNPIIFYRSIEQSIGSPDNSMVGFNFKANFVRHAQVYGQFILDEFNFSKFKNKWWGNKYGFQLGAKYIDIGGIKNLDAQAEFNMVRPYTYTHNSINPGALANYTHYNQPLAHPFGSNFREFILVIRYQPIPRLNLTLKYLHTTVGEDTSGINWGSNIFLPTSFSTMPLGGDNGYGNKTTQGVKNTYNILHLMASYQIRHNVFFDFQYSIRARNSVMNEADHTTQYFYFGVRVNMPRRTYDF
ncbi:MAG: capsule assembly Wzi family protein [Bacteroidota bacterium]